MAGRGSSHVRSASVPCHSQSQAVVTQVEDQLVALRSWTSNPARQNRMSLAHVRALLCLLDDLLLLLHHRSDDDQLEPLLHGFLLLADAFGSFLAALLALRQYAADLRAALRRHEHAKASAAARAQRQVAKEIQRLAAALTRYPTNSLLVNVVSRTVAEAINHTAVASAAVFVEVAALADAAAALAASPSSSTSNNKKHKQKQLPNNLVLNASEKLQELDQFVAELESESEKVFRSLVQTRVSLLNIHTPTF